MPYNLLRLVDGVKPQFTWLIQTVDLSKHRGPSSSLWHRFWQLFRHALVCAHTQLHPPAGVALINELKVQRCFCVRAYARVCDRRSLCTHVDFSSRTQTVGHVYVAYCLIYFCWCVPLYHVVDVHWLRACLRDANWMVIYACGVSPSPSFPRFISIYDQQKELFFQRRQDRSESPPAWSDPDTLDIDLSKIKTSTTKPRFCARLQAASNQLPGSHGFL